jgi:hypothetical protein
MQYILFGQALSFPKIRLQFATSQFVNFETLCLARCLKSETGGAPCSGGTSTGFICCALKVVNPNRIDAKRLHQPPVRIAVAPAAATVAVAS